jgi:hypothetical protein
MMHVDLAQAGYRGISMDDFGYIEEEFSDISSAMRDEV